MAEITPELEQRIRERAYFIWLYRQEFDIVFTSDRLGNIREITAQDDWLEAKAEELCQKL